MDKDKILLLTPEELDTIGEVMNISIGASATALSTMLEKQVTITAPELEQEQFKEIDCSDLEPAVIVKIRYVQGVEGINVTMFKRRDMQIILDLLMGNDDPVESEDFVFDDMTMSAASEVMNQMMGSSATALSEILNIPINISAPETQLVETKDQTEEVFSEIRGEEQVVSINFKLMIKGVLDTTFRCFLPIALAKEVVNTVSGQIDQPEDNTAGEQSVAQPAAPQASAPQQEAVPQFVNPPIQQPVQPPVQPPMQQPLVQPPIQPQMQPPIQPVQPPLQQAVGYHQLPQMDNYPPIQQQSMNEQAQFTPPTQNFAPYDPVQMQQMRGTDPRVNVRSAAFPDFAPRQITEQVPYSSNMKLLLGVQLEVSVIIGRTKRKIKDIMDFGQGTVVLLDTQTGAPAEIFVNGQLLAYGDVVVVGDNFGVRITEIVGTKELMESLGSDY
ncbi:MAG: flagellar motor switch phosphatase FliY [Clostridiales bacterium]|nr:flagellar motor switch phosphatase FliY [Clostridiales bacterium]